MKKQYKTFWSVRYSVVGDLRNPHREWFETKAEAEEFRNRILINGGGADDIIHRTYSKPEKIKSAWNRVYHVVEEW